MVRVSAVGIALGALIAAPLLAGSAFGFAPGALLGASAAGFAAAVRSVGWVLVPQSLLAVAIFAIALERLACRTAGLTLDSAPGWLDPAVESALLLGLLGTISGMVAGFVGLSPDALEPGPLIHSLGQALRSSFVGFLIALVGVWVKVRPAEEPQAAYREVVVA